MNKMTQIIIEQNKKEKERADCLVCSICGKTEDDNSWADDGWTMRRNIIELRDVTCYPEGQFGDITLIDLCPACVKLHLINWLVSLGVEVEKFTFAA